MAAKQQDKPHAEPEKPERPQLGAVIGRHVLHTLGQPSDLHRVQVRQLWDDHYRVNVFVGPDAASAKVAHSYFLVADGGGNIVASSPRITKEY
jgi:predicted NBD/HSP70 family sugar kinase